MKPFPRATAAAGMLIALTGLALAHGQSDTSPHHPGPHQLGPRHADTKCCDAAAPRRLLFARVPVVAPSTTRSLLD